LSITRKNGSTSTHRMAVIGGTGFGRAFLQGEPETIATAYGDASVVRARQDGREIVFLARHGAGHNIPPHRINHRANITALRELEVSHVFATAAVGSLRTDMAPGEFVILDDFVDLTRGDVVTFFDQVGDVRHTDFSEPYDSVLRGRLINAAEHCSTSIGPSVVHPAGTYLCLSGPRYETPAEIRMFASWGCDVVGMTGAPEAILCREAEIPYASIAIITNYGCGLVSSGALGHAEVEKQMDISRAFLVDVFLELAREC
jgi:5'-methylthioadenosine phosphorylase